MERILPNSAGVLHSVVAAEVQGLEMGVFHDGSAYLTARTLAKLCGIHVSSLQEITFHWHEGDRTRFFAKWLVEKGIDRPILCHKIYYQNQWVVTYPEDVCMDFLEYFAYFSRAKTEIALKYYRLLSRAGLRLFVYTATQYDPKEQVDPQWKAYFDRTFLNKPPMGYFSVFQEMRDPHMEAVRHGLPCDQYSLPDISVGMTWSNHWKKHDFDKEYGLRKTMPHAYPNYMSQSAANPKIVAFIYPNNALPAFRKWLYEEYMPKKFQDYLMGKVKKGELTTNQIMPILEALVPGMKDKLEEKIKAKTQNRALSRPTKKPRKRPIPLMEP